MHWKRSWKDIFIKRVDQPIFCCSIWFSWYIYTYSAMFIDIGVVISSYRCKRSNLYIYIYIVKSANVKPHQNTRRQEAHSQFFGRMDCAKIRRKSNCKMNRKYILKSELGKLSNAMVTLYGSLGIYLPIACESDMMIRSILIVHHNEYKLDQE